MKVVWTEQAWERLLEIEAFVARDNPAAATQLVDNLIERGDALIRYPDRGRTVPEIPGSGLRELIIGNYRIIYRRGPNIVEILTVFEGRRRLRREELPTDI